MQRVDIPQLIAQLQAAQEKAAQTTFTEQDLRQLAQSAGLDEQTYDQLLSQTIAQAQGHLKANHYKRAASAFEQAASLSPNNVEILRGLLNTYARWWRQTRRREPAEKAKQYAEWLIQLQPNLQEPYEVLAELEKPTPTKPWFGNTKNPFFKVKSKNDYFPIVFACLLGIYLTFILFTSITNTSLLTKNKQNVSNTTQPDKNVGFSIAGVPNRLVYERREVFTYHTPNELTAWITSVTPAKNTLNEVEYTCRLYQIGFSPERLLKTIQVGIFGFADVGNEHPLIARIYGDLLISTNPFQVRSAVSGDLLWQKDSLSLFLKIKPDDKITQISHHKLQGWLQVKTKNNSLYLFDPVARKGYLAFEKSPLITQESWFFYTQQSTEKGLFLVKQQIPTNEAPVPTNRSKSVYTNFVRGREDLEALAMPTEILMQTGFLFVKPLNLYNNDEGILVLHHSKTSKGFFPRYSPEISWIDRTGKIVWSKNVWWWATGRKLFQNPPFQYLQVEKAGSTLYINLVCSVDYNNQKDFIQISALDLSTQVLRVLNRP